MPEIKIWINMNGKFAQINVEDSWNIFKLKPIIKETLHPLFSNVAIINIVIKSSTGFTFRGDEIISNLNLPTTRENCLCVKPPGN